MPEGHEELSDDEKHLASLGYTQELNRSWSSFSNFAISFSIISILAGCFTSFGLGWNNGGPAAIAWGWPIVSAFILMIGLCMSELVSAFPTSGGIYWWAAKLGGTKAGFYTGWLNLIGLIAILASTAYGAATFLDLTLGTFSETKGPQGTTFGSSALAGTIRYITKKPDLDAVGGYLQSALKATDGASLGYQADGAVNLPIVPGVFGIRASGFYANLPGWIDNRFDKGANNESSKAARVEARWKITDDLTLDGMAMYQTVHQDAKNFYNTLDYSGKPLSGSTYQQADYARAPYDDKSQIYNATLTYKQSWGTWAPASTY